MVTAWMMMIAAQGNGEGMNKFIAPWKKMVKNMLGDTDNDAAVFLAKVGEGF